MGAAKASPGAKFLGPEAKNKGDWEGKPCTNRAEPQPANTVQSRGARPVHQGARGSFSSRFIADKAPITGVAMGKRPLIGLAEAMASNYFFKFSIFFQAIPPNQASPTGLVRPDSGLGLGTDTPWPAAPEAATGCPATGPVRIGPQRWLQP